MIPKLVVAGILLAGAELGPPIFADGGWVQWIETSGIRTIVDAQKKTREGREPITWSVYDGLLADERIVWVEEPSGLEASWRKFAGGSNASPKLWMDAYLAAFALAGGYQLVTSDKAFLQFKGLDVVVLSKS